ncbi:hypothetical protein [Xanthobacter sediminis]
MSDEPKDLRIPIMMSASEVKAIDDWSFENRIRTRAEAVRRLCQMALIFDENADAIIKSINDQMKFVISSTKDLFDNFKDPEQATKSDMMKYIVDSGDVFVELIDRMSISLSLMTLVYAPTRGLKNNEDTDDAISQFKIDFSEAIAKHIELKTQIYEQRKKYESE